MNIIPPIPPAVHIKVITYHHLFLLQLKTLNALHKQQSSSPTVCLWKKHERCGDERQKKNRTISKSLIYLFYQKQSFNRQFRCPLTNITGCKKAILSIFSYPCYTVIGQEQLSSVKQQRPPTKTAPPITHDPARYRWSEKLLFIDNDAEKCQGQYSVHTTEQVSPLRIFSFSREKIEFME
jgi:hypothetical protein